MKKAKVMPDRREVKPGHDIGSSQSQHALAFLSFSPQTRPGELDTWSDRIRERMAVGEKEATFSLPPRGRRSG